MGLVYEFFIFSQSDFGIVQCDVTSDLLRYGNGRIVHNVGVQLNQNDFGVQEVHSRDSVRHSSYFNGLLVKRI